MLEVRRAVAQPADRVGVVVNAYRERPVADRVALDIVSPEALALLTDLKAVIVTGMDLFLLWLATLEGIDARPKIEGLMTNPPGLVRLS